MNFEIDIDDELVEEDRLAHQLLQQIPNDNGPPRLDHDDNLYEENKMEEELDNNDQQHNNGDQRINGDSDEIKVPYGGSKKGLFLSHKELQSINKNSKQILAKENIDALKSFYYVLNEKLAQLTKDYP